MGLFGIRRWPLFLGELGLLPRLMTNVTCVRSIFLRPLHTSLRIVESCRA